MFLNQIFGAGSSDYNIKITESSDKKFGENEVWDRRVGNTSRLFGKNKSERVSEHRNSVNSEVVFENQTVRKPEKTIKIGMYSIDSSYEISLLALVMIDKLFKKYGSKCLYLCHKPFSLLKKNYFGCASAYSDKEDIRKLAKFLFYMDDNSFSDKRHLIESVHNLDYIFTYGTDKLLGNPNYNGITRLVNWIEDSNIYNYILCDVGESLDLDSIDLLRECDVIVRGSRNFPASMDTLNMDKSRTIDVIFDEKTESDLGFYASDIDKVDMLRDGEFSYTFQLNNDLEFLVESLVEGNKEKPISISKDTFGHGLN